MCGACSGPDVSGKARSGGSLGIEPGMARAISGLPCNRARGKVRNRNAVAKKRSDLGLRKRGGW